MNTTTKILLLIIIVIIIIVLVVSLARSSSNSFPEVKCDIGQYQRRSTSITKPDPSLRSTSATSTNWAGYVVANSLTNPGINTATVVNGTFVVPSLTSINEPTNDNVSIWIGIDGVFNSDPTVQQMGIDLAYENGHTVIYTWFELYPAGAYEIGGFPANVGDNITLSIMLSSYRNGISTYIMKIVNNTRRVQFTIPTSYTTARGVSNMCAEWIVEAPSLGSTVVPLSSFTPPVVWSNCTATVSGSTGPISRTPYLQLNMVNSSGLVKATTSNLTSTGNGFTVTWHHN
jgi:hypothetical protein